MGAMTLTYLYEIIDAFYIHKNAIEIY